MGNQQKLFLQFPVKKIRLNQAILISLILRAIETFERMYFSALCQQFVSFGRSKSTNQISEVERNIFKSSLISV